MTHMRSPRELDTAVPARPRTGSRRRDRRHDRRHTASAWRPLDPLDRAWSGVGFVRAVTGIDAPAPEYVRDALLDLAVLAPELGRWTRDLPPRWRSIGSGELPAWLQRAFVASGEAGVGPQRAMELNLGPLSDVPLRVLAGPDWLSVRMSHTLGDGWTVDTVIAHLLRQATAPELLPLPWHVVSTRRRDAMLVRDIARRLPVLAHAVRHRRELAGGRYEPAGRAADLMVDHSYAITDGEFPGRVRALRDRLFPQASVAALTLTGLRAALAASSLPSLRPGFECLFNTRSPGDGTADAWGNWSAGVFVNPTDDLDPVAVNAEMKRVRESGLPVLARASLRARAHRSDATTITMPSAVGAPRLTMSYVNGRGLAAALPGLRPDSEFGTWTRPNGTESITVQTVECLGRLSVGLSFFPDVWPADVVCGAVERFLRDPAPILAELPGAAR